MGKIKGVKIPNAQSGKANKVAAEKLFIIFICRIKTEDNCQRTTRNLKVFRRVGGGDGYVVKGAGSDSGGLGKLVLYVVGTYRFCVME